MYIQTIFTSSKINLAQNIVENRWYYPFYERREPLISCKILEATKKSKSWTQRSPKIVIFVFFWNWQFSKAHHNVTDLLMPLTWIGRVDENKLSVLFFFIQRAYSTYKVTACQTHFFLTKMTEFSSNFLKFLTVDVNFCNFLRRSHSASANSKQLLLFHMKCDFIQTLDC